MRWLWLVWVGLWVGCASRRHTTGPSATHPQPYTRRVESTNGTISLEVGLRRFVPRGRSAHEIWLVGVTHLGTSNYYARLQQFLDRQDLVLFEGIGATNKQFRSTQNEGFSLQPALAKALGLRFQLTTIDYDRAHWENSDLSVAELVRRLPSDPETGGFKELMAVFEGEGAFGGIAKFGVGLLALSPRLQATAKLMLIETLGGLGGAIPEAPDLGFDTRELLRVLIEERNAVVVHDLRAALATSTRPRRIAIFYGAGHMQDLEARLRKDLALLPIENQWLRAFGVNPERAGLTRFEVETIRDAVLRELGPAQPSSLPRPGK